MDLISAQRIRRLRDEARSDPARRADVVLSLSDLASELSERGLHDAAVEASRHALELGESLAAEEPETPVAAVPRLLDQLGIVLRAADRHAEALACSRRAVAELQERAGDDPIAQDVLATALINLAVDLDHDGQASARVDALRRAVEIYEPLDAERYAEDLADALERLGRALLANGRTDKSVEPLERSVSLYVRLVERDRVHLDDLHSAAFALLRTHRRRGDKQAELATARRAAEAFELRAATDPLARRLLARWLRETARAGHGTTGQATNAAAAERAVELCEGLAERDEQCLPELAASLGLLGRMYASPTGRATDGLAPARRAVRMRETLLGAGRGDVGDLALALEDLAFVAGQADQRSEALQASRRAVDLLRSPEAGSSADALARALNALAVALDRCGEHEAARAALGQALGLLDSVEGADAERDRALARASTNMADVLVTLGRPEEALAHAERAVSIRQRTRDSDQEAAEYLPSSLMQLAAVLRAQERESDALGHAARAAAMLRASARSGASRDSPSLTDALEQLARCLTAVGDADSARAVEREAARAAAQATR